MQKTILDYNMGFRTRSRSSSIDSFASIDNYQTKKRKLKSVKEEVVDTLQKVVEEKEGALVIAEEEKLPKKQTKTEQKTGNKIKNVKFE